MKRGTRVNFTSTLLIQEKRQPHTIPHKQDEMFYYKITKLHEYLIILNLIIELLIKLLIFHFNYVSDFINI